MNRLVKGLTAALSSKAVMIAAVFLAAVLLWYYGYMTNDPVETRSYKFALSLRNTSELARNDKFLRNSQSLAGQEVTVKIRTSRKVHLALQEDERRSALSCYLDFGVSHLLNANGNVYAEVRFDLPSKYDNASDYSVERVSLSPEMVLAEFDVIEEKTLSVKARMTADVNDDPNYSLSPFTCEPDKITVRGPSVELNKITAIEAPISAPATDISLPGAPNDYTAKTTPRALDRNGLAVESENITFMGISTQIVVSYSVVKTKEIPVIAPEIIGEPEEGYAVNPFEKFVSVEPKTVWIKGAKEDVDGIVNIKLDAVNISEMSDKSPPITENLRKYLLEANNRLEFVNLNNTEATIDVRIEKLETREAYFYTTKLELLNPSDEVRVPTGSIQKPVSVRAVSSLMEDFSIYKVVTGTVDLAPFVGQRPGEYEAEVVFTVKEGYTLLDSEPAKVKVVILEVPSEEDDNVSE